MKTIDFLDLTVPDTIEAYGFGGLRGVVRLIAKTASTHLEILDGFRVHGDTYRRTKRCAEKVAERGAYAQVAADVFNLCTPTHWEMAVQHAVEAAKDFEPTGAHSREANIVRRAQWVKTLVASVNAELGLGEV